MLFIIESILRTFIILAQSLWRRTSGHFLKPIKWLYMYLFNLLLVFILVLASPYRSALFLALCGWFRKNDDILDGDDPNPPASMKDYICDKNKVLEGIRRGDASVDIKGSDRLLYIAKFLAHRLSLDSDFIEGVSTVWELMVQEYNRRMKKEESSVGELEIFAMEQDSAIFKMGALVLGANRSALDALTFYKLGVFTRSDWISDLDQNLNPEQEIDTLIDLWRQVEKEKSLIHSSFPSNLLALAYKYILIRPIEVKFKNIVTP